MKRVFATCCLMVLALSAGSMSAGDLDFTLVNQTGLTINEFYVSPSNHDEWGEDVLGRDVLAHGQRVDITFSRKETECMWDLKIVDADDDDVIWQDINLCKASEITLQYKGKTPTALIK
jgi:hypothetical protein